MSTDQIWVVEIYEYERGWGRTLIDTNKFTSYQVAVAFQKKFNSKNTAPVAPDWYMVAMNPFAEN